MKYLVFLVFFSLSNVLFSQNKINEEIQCCEVIKSKFYISIILPNKSKLNVPVVNGLLPEIKNFYNKDGSVRRVYNYTREIPYTGGTPDYEPLTNDLLKCPSAKVPYDINPLSVPVPSSSESESEFRMKKGSDVNGKIKISPTYQ